MIKQQLGEPIEGEYPPEFVERYPELAGIVSTSSDAVHSFTYTRLITSPRPRRAGTSSPSMTWPNTVYLPSRSGRSASVT